MGTVGVWYNTVITSYSIHYTKLYEKYRTKITRYDYGATACDKGDENDMEITPEIQEGIFMIIEINPKNPQVRLIKKVADILRDGGVIAYPTDTYYGIGCDIMNKKAIQRIYQLKQRNKEQPFSFICADLKNISDYAKVSNYAYKTMRRSLPGPFV